MAAKQKILIVDDDNNIAELISLYLTKECFDTKIVNDGEEALIAFEQYNPNLILLDLMLPGIDGYQVCREVRAKANVPIIMLSAKGEIFDKVLGLELGADDYMMKPFDSKELVARVKAVLRRYRGGDPGSEMCQIRRSGHQSLELLCHLYGAGSGYAAEGTGTFVFPCFLPKSGFHQRTVIRPHLGL